MSSHEVRRDVTDEEKRLWTLVRNAYEESEFDEISAYELGTQHIGMHRGRIQQIVATWDNEGLVNSKNGNRAVFVTEYGRQCEIIESTNVSGESWR